MCVLVGHKQFEQNARLKTLQCWCVSTAPGDDLAAAVGVIHITCYKILTDDKSRVTQHSVPCVLTQENAMIA